MIHNSNKFCQKKLLNLTSIYLKQYKLQCVFYFLLGFPGGSEVKVSAYNAGDTGSISGSGRSPGEGNGSPLQYSCLENPRDRGAWWVQSTSKEADTTERLHFHFHSLFSKLQCVIYFRWQWKQSVHWEKINYNQ